MNIIKIRVMPESTGINLKKVKIMIEKEVGSLGGKIHASEEQEVAFGLKSLIVVVMWPDEKGTDELEEAIKKIEGVNSAQTIDMRRAIG